jgi:hypothetical protein
VPNELRISGKRPPRGRTTYLPQHAIGLVEIDDGEWDVYFGPLRLGRFHERTLRIEDALGRQHRRRYGKVLPMSLDCFVSHVLDRSAAAESLGAAALDPGKGRARRPRRGHRRKLLVYRKMRTAGVEPAPLTGQDPKSCASASSATFASARKILGSRVRCR